MDLILPDELPSSDDKTPIYIEDIKDDNLRKLAIKRTLEDREFKDKDENFVLKLPLINAFLWDRSPEGHNFWIGVRTGKIKIFNKKTLKLKFKSL